METLNRGRIAIVLVEPITAGNIGSVARAMVNMGFPDLRLVNPKCDHLNEQARCMAHGSEQMLKQARLFPSLTEAIADCSLVVASSHEKVRNSQVCLSSKELGEKLVPYCVHNQVAILFGREDSGLTNDEVNLCAWVVSIPAASSYPSLNLAQAAMLICYELFLSSVPPLVPHIPELVGNHAMELFYRNVLEILDRSGFRHKNGRSEIFIGALRRIFGRTGFEERDLRVLYKLFNQVKFILEQQQTEKENTLEKQIPS